MIDALKRRVRSLRATLWTLVVPPATWAAHFLFSYLWASVLCAKTGEFATHPAVFWTGTAIALLVIAATSGIAWVQSRTPGDKPPHESGTQVDRLRFIAYSTLLLSGLSFIGVAFTAVPVLFFETCL